MKGPLRCICTCCKLCWVIFIVALVIVLDPTRQQNRQKFPKIQFDLPTQGQAKTTLDALIGRILHVRNFSNHGMCPAPI